MASHNGLLSKITADHSPANQSEQSFGEKLILAQKEALQLQCEPDIYNTLLDVVHELHPTNETRWSGSLLAKELVQLQIRYNDLNEANRASMSEKQTLMKNKALTFLFSMSLRCQFQFIQDVLNQERVKDVEAKRNCTSSYPSPSDAYRNITSDFWSQDAICSFHHKSVSDMLSSLAEIENKNKEGSIASTFVKMFLRTFGSAPIIEVKRYGTNSDPLPKEQLDQSNNIEHLTVELSSEISEATNVSNVDSFDTVEESVDDILNDVNVIENVEKVENVTLPSSNITSEVDEPQGNDNITLLVEDTETPQPEKITKEDSLSYYKNLVHDLLPQVALVCGFIPLIAILTSSRLRMLLWRSARELFTMKTRSISSEFSKGVIRVLSTVILIISIRYAVPDLKMYESITHVGNIVVCLCTLILLSSQGSKTAGQ